MRIRDLTCGYRRVEVVKVRDVSFPPSAYTLLLGHNGSGKSTFLKTVARIIPPIRGKIDSSITTSLLPEDLHFPESLSTVAIFSSLCPWEDRRACIFDELGISEKKLFLHLSKGSRQKFRIALAESLAAWLGRSLLCLDEPLSGLDVTSREKILGAWRGDGELGRIWGRFTGHRILSQHSGKAPDVCQTLVIIDGEMKTVGPIKNCDNWPNEVKDLTAHA